MRKFFLLLSAIICLFGFDKASWATEGGGGAYANGAEDFAVGYCMKPGLYFVDYFAFVNANRFNGRDGNNKIPGFEAQVIGNGFKFSYITDMKILGGNWGMQAAVPVATLTVKVPGSTRRRTGLGDIIVNPLILGWQTGSLCYASGVNFFLPTSDYDKGRPNIGRNYYTFEPFVAATYRTRNGFDFSGIFYYDINTENPKTDYLSGQEFHFDYSIAKMFGSIGLGAGGYFYQQVTNDTRNGTKVGTDGNRGQTFAIGPEVRYVYKNIRLTLKYQKEIEAYDRPQGYKAWLKFIYVF